jgi:RNA 2',3'-cyclic 3'-phosphodiesterase
MSLSLLRGGLPGARWIDTENYHLTLRFIGDVDGRTADDLVRELDRIRVSAFQLGLCGVGSFGAKKPHAIWAGTTPCPPLFTLQGDVAKACNRIQVAPDPRKFTPHVTIARLKGATDGATANWLTIRGSFATLPFKVSRFVLMSSKDSVGGGPYVIEEAFNLLPGNATSASAAAEMGSTGVSR